jgi:non-ribosomal peptide synthetase component E (peptide arylation enzyme)
LQLAGIEATQKFLARHPNVIHRAVVKSFDQFLGARLSNFVG